MKKIFLSALVLGVTANTFAQNAASDTVLTGPQYAQQVWYSLETGQKTTIDKTSWDIALSAKSFSVAIMVNDGANTHLWKHPTAAITDWNTVDTTGISTWEESYNSETDWEEGAFNAFPNGSYDYGWGGYDMNTHNVTGNSIFIIQLSNGDYKKLIIEELLANGTYNFKYADLDGSNEENVSLDKADFPNKNFAYYNLTTNQAENLEPASNEWDLLFGQYTSFIPTGPGTVMAYKVTGVLNNVDVLTAKVEGVDAVNYSDYQSHTLDSAKNTIGYDWKTFDMNNNVYNMADSTVFFVQDKSENIWKVIFTGFGGSADGSFSFSKEKLITTSIRNADNKIASLAIYPNPVTNGSVTLAFQLKGNAQNVHFTVYDNMGRTQFQSTENAQMGMNTKTISTDSWAKGMYFLNMEIEGSKTVQKIIIR